MKNQYFGDINDYRKYGLLRILTNGGEIKTAVCWMLTTDDEAIVGHLQPLTRATHHHIILMFQRTSRLGVCRATHTSQAEALRGAGGHYWATIIHRHGSRSCLASVY